MRVIKKPKKIRVSTKRANIKINEIDEDDDSEEETSIYENISIQKYHIVR